MANFWLLMTVKLKPSYGKEQMCQAQRQSKTLLAERQLWNQVEEHQNVAGVS